MVIPVVLFLLGTPETAPAAPPLPRTEVATPAQAEIEKVAALLFGPKAPRNEAVLERMTRVADADRSRDVTLAEATELRIAVDFGTRLASLVKKKMDRARQEKILGVTREEYEARAKTYRRLAYALNGLAAVPSIEADPAQKGSPGPGF